MADATAQGVTLPHAGAALAIIRRLDVLQRSLNARATEMGTITATPVMTLDDARAQLSAPTATEIATAEASLDALRRTRPERAAVSRNAGLFAYLLFMLLDHWEEHRMLRDLRQATDVHRHHERWLHTVHGNSAAARLQAIALAEHVAAVGRSNDSIDHLKRDIEHTVRLQCLLAQVQSLIAHRRIDSLAADRLYGQINDAASLEGTSLQTALAALTSQVTLPAADPHPASGMRPRQHHAPRAASHPA